MKFVAASAFVDLLERKNALTPIKGRASSPPALGSGSIAYLIPASLTWIHR